MTVPSLPDHIYTNQAMQGTILRHSWLHCTIVFSIVHVILYVMAIRDTKLPVIKLVASLFFSILLLPIVQESMGVLLIPFREVDVMAMIGFLTALAAAGHIQRRKWLVTGQVHGVNAVFDC